MRTIFKVDIVKSERGVGTKIKETFWFSNESLASEFMTLYNARTMELSEKDIKTYADYPYGMQVPGENDILDSLVSVYDIAPPQKQTVYDTKQLTRDED